MAGLISIYFTDLDYPDVRQSSHGRLPVVDLPISEKAGILADMITECRNDPADDELFVIGSAAGFAYADLGLRGTANL